MTFDFKTVMRDDSELRLYGQVAVELLSDGRVRLHVMTAPGTFASDCVISAADAAAMGYTLRCTGGAA